MKFKISLLLLIMISVVLSYAQPVSASGKTGAVYGVIVDADNEKPVEYCNIVLWNYDSVLVTGNITNTEGVFILENVPLGTYWLNASFIGYKNVKVDSVVVSAENPAVNLGKLVLSKTASTLKGVEIIGETTTVEYQIDKKVVNVGKDVSTSGGTASDALKNVPGVEVDIDGNVTLRGSGGFRVLIDGKPTLLDPNDVLRQVPASAILRIEIITNPSAKYDPEGVSGIVNIIMKKQTQDGFNGMINASIGAPRDKYNSDVLFNYRKNRVNFFFGGDINYNVWIPYDTSDRSSWSGDTIYYVNSITRREMVRKGYNFKAGVDFYKDDKNTLQLEANVGYWGFERIFSTKYDDWSTLNPNNNYSLSDELFEIGGNYMGGTFFYKRLFEGEGHELSVIANSSLWIGVSDNSNMQVVTDAEYNPLSTAIADERKAKEENDRGRYVFRVDYVKPMKNDQKLETGWQSKFVSGLSDFSYLDYDPVQMIWILNNQYTNSTEYKLNVHALYATWSGKFKGFSYSGGLRSEYTDRLMDQKTLDQKFDLYRWDLYPSAYITRQMKKKQQIQVSYSRRVQRPQPWFLNPFPDYSDKYTISHGNPNLLPANIDSWELNYVKRLDIGYYSVELFHRQTHDMMTRIIEINDQNQLAVTFDNINRDYATGIEFSTNLNLAKWFFINVGGSFFNYEVKGEISDESINQKTNSWNIRSNGTFRFSTSTVLQLNFFYSGPSINIQGDVDAFFVAGAAFRQDFLKRTLSATISVQDIFSTGSRHMTFSQSDYFIDFILVPDSPMMTFALSYRINNYKRINRDSGIPDDFQQGGGVM